MTAERHVMMGGHPNGTAAQSPGTVPDHTGTAAHCFGTAARCLGIAAQWCAGRGDELARMTQALLDYGKMSHA